MDVTQLTEELNQVEGVTNIHDVHIWSLDGSYNVGSLHAVTRDLAGKPEPDYEQNHSTDAEIQHSTSYRSN